MAPIVFSSTQLWDFDLVDMLRCVSVEFYLMALNDIVEFIVA